MTTRLVLDQMKDVIAHLGEAGRQALAKGLRARRDEVLATARATMPVNTGRLRDSLRAVDGDLRAAIGVGDGIDYELSAKFGRRDARQGQSIVLALIGRPMADGELAADEVRRALGVSDGGR